MKAVLFAIILTITASACNSIRIGKKPQPLVIEKTFTRDTTIYLPSAAIRDTTRIVFNSKDTVFQTFEKTLYDPETRAKLQLAMDRFGRLQAYCTSLPDTVLVPKYIEKEIIREMPCQNSPDFDYIKWGAILIAGILVFILIFKK